MKFKRYGRTWYTEEEEAEEDKKSSEKICFDSGLKAYYIEKPKKSIWDF